MKSKATNWTILEIDTKPIPEEQLLKSVSLAGRVCHGRGFAAAMLTADRHGFEPPAQPANGSALQARTPMCFILSNNGIARSTVASPVGRRLVLA